MAVTTRNFDGSFEYIKYFFIKRIVRVWPLYFIASILTVIFMVSMGNAFDQSSIIKLIKSILFIPIGTGSAPVFGFPYLVVGWTLNYEMCFYLIFGMSMFAGKLRWPLFYLLAFVFLIVIPIIKTGYFSFDPTISYGFTNYFLMLSTSPIMFLFVVGALIGNLHSSNFKIKSSIFCWHLVLLSTCLVIAQFASRSRIGHGIDDWGLSLIPLLTSFAIASKTVDIKINKSLIYIGNISFSLYLFHPIIQSVIAHLLVNIGFGDFSYGFQYLFISTGACIAAGTISYYIFENKISHIIKRLTHPQSRWVGELLNK